MAAASCAGVRPCSAQVGSCFASVPSTGPAWHVAPHLYHDLALTRAPLLSNPQNNFCLSWMALFRHYLGHVGHAG